MNRELHLTNLTFDKNTNIDNDYFAGIWCLNKDQLLNYNKYNILKYHWSNNIKFIDDINYINSLYPKLLNTISISLSKTIHKNFQSENLKILLSHWLTIYLSVIYDRWLIIGNILGKNFKIKTLNKKINHERPLSYIECVKLYQSSEWNEEIFRDLINYYERNIKIENNIDNNFSQKIILTQKNKNFVNPYNLFHLLNFFKKSKNKTVFFIDQNFMNFPNLLKFYLKYKNQFKEIDDKMLELQADVKSIEKFYEILPEQTNKFNFENFFYYRLKKDIPLSYISNPLNIFDDGRKKIFISGSKHQSCDLSKWRIVIAKNYNHENQLIVSRHGGGLPAAQPERFSQDQLIADYCLTFTKSYDSINIQASNLKIKKIKLINKLIYKLFPKKDILIVGFENLKFCHKMTFSYLSGNYLEYLKLLDNLFLFLINKPKIKIYFRPYTKRSSWNIINHIKIKFKNSIVIDKKKHFLNSISCYKLIVCTYPQTTFSECIHNNIPVVLLFDPSVWKIDDNFIDFVQELIDLGIVHTNLESFKEFYDKNYNNITSFWMKKDVQIILKKYKDLFLGNNLQSMKIWEKIFKQ